MIAFMVKMFIKSVEDLQFGFNPDKPSKTHNKTVATGLQNMGAAMILLSKEQLKKLNLPETLLEAIKLAQRITSNGATARQKQFIGKLMRALSDEEVAAIQEQLDIWDGVSKVAVKALHTIEFWRDQLIADDAQLQVFLNDVIDTREIDFDLQHVRNLIRQARKDRDAATKAVAAGHATKSSKASKELFQVVKDILASPESIEDDAASDATSNAART